MSASAGAGGLSGIGGITTPGIVGQETPQWEFPMGIESIDADIREAFMRTDFGPSGLNEFLQQLMRDKPETADRLRSFINGGMIKPKNQAAMNVARGYGGLQAGDETLLGPLIDGMPEGLTPEYWAIVIEKAKQAANEQIAIMEQTGYFEGKSTLERERIEAEISNNIARTEIDRRLADNTIRSTDLDEAYRRDAMAQDMRQNVIAQFGYDPGPQGAMGAAVGNENASVFGPDGNLPMPGSPEQQQQLEMFKSYQQTGKMTGGTMPGQTAAPGMMALDAQGQPQPQAQGAQAPGGPSPGVQNQAAATATGATSATQAGAPTQQGAPGMPPMPGAQGMPNMTGSAAGRRPNMTTQVGSDVGWQWVDGVGWTQTLGGRGADLSQQQQAWQQQADVAALASNPRNYIQAQMLGNARGGMAGMGPNNQVSATTQSPYTWGGNQMPGNAQLPGGGMGPGGMPYAQPEQMPWGQPGASGMTNEQMGQYGIDRASIAARKGAMDGQPPQEPMMSDMRYRPPQTEGPGSGTLVPGVEWNPGMGGQPWAPPNMGRFQPPGAGGWGMKGMPMAQPLQAGQGTQTAMGGWGRPGGQMRNAGQPQEFSVGAFSQALNKNRLVPKSGGMNTQGAMMTMDQIQQQTNPQKWRAQDFMRGNASEKQQALGTASAAGFSDEDTQSMLGKNLPSFKAPGAGMMG